MSIFFAVIYAGGIFAYSKRKIGFFDRIIWPADLGRKLAEWAWKDQPHD